MQGEHLQHQQGRAAWSRHTIQHEWSVRHSQSTGTRPPAPGALQHPSPAANPAQVPGAWPGSGAPITFSTRDTREPGKGWYAVQAHVRALAGAHMRHMMVYGAGNDRRLTGRDK